MNNKNKTRITIIIALVLCFVGLISMASCDSDKNKITEIYITNADTPRLNYVEGQELDLSNGKLTAVVNGEETKIPLTAPDVTVSGYDKSKIGDQVITVKYADLTANFTVNVIARAVAENFETRYFVGDEFDKEMGRIKIATDDAKTFTVNMNSDKISLVSFDSTVAGTATVTVLYSDGTNSYYCQFDVTVYEESNIQFTAPTKTIYSSHDEGIDLNGGFFKVTASDTTLTKNVPLNADMITGFDLSAATLENRETPLEQTVTVKYLNSEFTYTIYITYSSLSTVNYYAELFSKVDWAKAKTDGLSDEESKAALDAIKEYYKLSDAQKELLSDEVKTTIGRVGAISVGNLFSKELGNYSQTLKVDEKLNLYLICSSYEQTAADLKKLQNPDENINVYSKLLRQIEADFGEVILAEETKIADFIYVYTEEIEESLLSVLNHLVEVYALLADVPDDWTVETLKAHGDDIVVATLQIHNSGYYKAGHANYYTNILSRWRTNNDFFELLYSYFLYAYEENGQEFMVTYMWDSMPMPGLLEKWYQGLSMALYYEKFYASYYSSNALLSDVSVFMYYYFHTLEIANEIKTSNDKLLIDIYTTYNGDYMNQVYMYTYSYGYLYHTKAMIDSANYHELWSRYYSLLKSYLAKNLSATDNKADICAMFDTFEKLTPSELYGFLSSMNLMYSSAKGILPMLQYDSDTAYNYFTVILRDYYLTYLNEANKPLFANLLLAMENYALVGYKDTALTDFNTIMQQLVADYSALSDADKANFDEYVGVSYKKYLNIYKFCTGNMTVELTAEEAALFEYLRQTVSDYFTVYGSIYNLVQSNQEVSPDLYAVMYSVYARASAIYNTILATASEDALVALSSKTYTLFETEISLEKAFYIIDNASTSIMTGQTATITTSNGNVAYVTLWNLFADYGLAEVLARMSDLLYFGYYNNEATLSTDYITSLMTTVRGLTVFQSKLLSFFSADVAYYASLEAYFTKTLSENAAKAAGDLLKAENDYVAYSLDKENAEKLNGFFASMEQAKTSYAALTEEEKAALSDMYNYCLSKYDEVKSSTQGAA